MTKKTPFPFPPSHPQRTRDVASRRPPQSRPTRPHTPEAASYSHVTPHTPDGVSYHPVPLHTPEAAHIVVYVHEPQRQPHIALRMLHPHVLQVFGRTALQLLHLSPQALHHTVHTAMLHLCAIQIRSHRTALPLTNVFHPSLRLHHQMTTYLRVALRCPCLPSPWFTLLVTTGLGQCHLRHGCSIRPPVLLPVSVGRAWHRSLADRVLCLQDPP